MGILNLTPDSFFDGGKFNTIDRALEQIEKMIADGADFIDLGACSTRPGAPEISETEEQKRLFPVLEKLLENFLRFIIPLILTERLLPKVPYPRGAAIINDISGGQFDPQMMQTVGRFNAPYVLMHIAGNLEKCKIIHNMKMLFRRY